MIAYGPLSFSSRRFHPDMFPSAMMRADRKLAWGWALVLSLWLACIAWTAASLPIEPVATGDSPSYLTLASHRPPVYGWVLNAYLWITGGLAHLPLLQLLLFASGLLIFAVELECAAGERFRRPCRDCSDCGA